MLTKVRERCGFGELCDDTGNFDECDREERGMKSLRNHLWALSTDVELGRHLLQISPCWAKLGEVKRRYSGDNTVPYPFREALTLEIKAELQAFQDPEVEPSQCESDVMLSFSKSGNNRRNMRNSRKEIAKHGDRITSSRARLLAWMQFSDGPETRVFLAGGEGGVSCSGKELKEDPWTAVVAMTQEVEDLGKSEITDYALKPRNG
ncbi:hypothetical protein H920_07284 [Fukomys damarensis]|uniref:Uncharacterized protein n=1 Tax=Fukomys damarensis TaxID=885580 RepID=A0A091DGU0_FUKDA|nr:hypothetical protein H920_07284 [Fukomys damarensis]